MAAALQVIEAVVQSNPRVLKDVAPLIGVARLADSAVHINIQPWVSVNDYGAATAEIARATLEALRAHHISVPVPQREVRLLTTPA
jgi:small conductance mechanosensitive channel